MRTIAIPVIALTATALLAGCGGGSKPAAVQPPKSAFAKGVAPAKFHPTKNPYKASVQYVHCMREHGIDLPDPKPNGDINLTPVDEKRMGPPGQKNEAADEECFHFLEGAVNEQPLSDAARGRMAAVMRRYASCMRKRGWKLGEPIVENMSRGRVRLFFPHESVEVMAAQQRHDAKIAADGRACERGQSARLDKAVGNER